MEALVAISLAGVISAIALPSASAYMSQYRIVGASSELAFEISRARMQAVGQNVFTRVRFLNTTSYARERSTDGGATYAQDGAAITLPPGISAGAATTTSFNKNGVATAVVATALTNGKITKTVRTGLLGRVTIS
ncbi:MAG: hypothetical protein HY699_17915 [Deltaproteobacteria bacterium]|nr:hypothetical protein [Deltaproteobacteria bacterium]